MEYYRGFLCVVNTESSVEDFCMRKRLREAWELLRELELDHHASHYASLFSGDRTAYIADLKEEELHELLEYLKRFHKPARRRSAGSAA